MSRILNVGVVFGLLYAAGHAGSAGVTRSDYVLVLFGALFVTLAACIALLTIRGGRYA